ncbi:MAG TPA: homoaconitate hydratase [Candidatus Dormibacteraeota bacterium]|nr:homoaconitate hydratase [Candidatus Dormibacteraeota bacterium]
MNESPAIQSPFEHAGPVKFYDTTLRDGEQSVGIVLPPAQKLEIARALDALGVGRIEAGFPRVSADDAEAFKLIAGAGLKAEVWGFSRAVRGDVDELLRLGARAAVIEAPTSSIKLAAYGISADQSRRRVGDAVGYARSHGVKVMFFSVDGTRTKLSELKSFYRTALDAGAEELAVVDTIGACGPEAVEFLVREVREWVGSSVPLHFHGHNDFGLATACAIAAVRGGAQWIQGTINGMGERAGNADIGEIALALRTLYNVNVELDLTKIREVSRIVCKASGYQVEPWKPVVGENLFMRESGAVASQFHIPEAIEPFSADLVGATRSVVLGKKSGLDSIAIKCKELGIEVPIEKHPAVLAGVKQLGTQQRRLVTDAEFREIIAAQGKP